MAGSGWCDGGGAARVVALRWDGKGRVDTWTVDGGEEGRLYVICMYNIV